MVYFENGQFTDTLKVSGVGTGSTQTYISYGVEFEVEPQEHRGFE
ncbi:hypothetical protein Tco_1580145, partial [Tanacetum coccineum]